MVRQDLHPQQGIGTGQESGCGFQVFPGIIHAGNQRNTHDKRLAAPAQAAQVFQNYRVVSSRIMLMESGIHELDIHHNEGKVFRNPSKQLR